MAEPKTRAQMRAFWAANGMLSDTQYTDELRNRESIHAFWSAQPRRGPVQGATGPAQTALSARQHARFARLLGGASSEVGADEPSIAPGPGQTPAAIGGMRSYAFKDSSAIKALLYDLEQETARVMFPRGTWYEYYGVPEDEIYYWSLADSLGRYFNANIRNHYAYARVG